MTSTAGRTDAPQKQYSPIIHLSTALSQAGSRLVEAAGYLDALNHLSALDEHDALRPRSKMADVREWLRKAEAACDEYEAALTAAKPTGAA